MKTDSILVGTILKTFRPKVENVIKSGKVDKFIQNMKKDYDLEVDETAEILITTETDGMEYLNIVAINQDLKITKILLQKKLTDTILSLFEKSELCL